MMLDKVGSYSFLTAPFHCDFSNRIFLSNLGNSLLNAADFHSNERNFGMHYLNTIHKTWVLSRLSIEIIEMPQAYSSYLVETWVDGVMRGFTHRNFRVIDALSGKIYAYGRSIWAMIDTETRQPTDLLAVNDGLIVDYIEREKECDMQPFSRVKIEKDARLRQTVLTHYSDVDPNGHINSIKYVEHLLNLWSIEWYQQHDIKRLDVAYVAESHCGDRLHYYVEEQEKGTFAIAIKKEEPMGEEQIEVCRLKLTFAKKSV